MRPRFRMPRLINLAFVAVHLFAASSLMAEGFAAHVNPETASGRMQAVQTRSGWLEVFKVGDTEFFRDEELMSVTVVDQRGSLYLLELNIGGNACGGFYTWLHTADQSPRLSERFGTCAYVTGVTSDALTVSVDMPSFDSTVGTVRFTYDGETITESEIGQSTIDVDPADDPAVLLGRYPHELFRAANWRDKLTGVLGPEGYVRVAEAVGLAAPFRQEGEWVVATGSVPPRQGDGQSIVAIHAVDGRMIVALRAAPDGLTVWGGDDMPQSMTEFIAAASQ